MDIPTAIKILQSDYDARHHPDDPDFYEALKVALQALWDKLAPRKGD